MISSIVKSDFAWGVLSIGTLDTATKAALKALKIHDDLLIRGITACAINLAVFAYSENRLLTLPGIAWGVLLQLKTLLNLYEEQFKLNESIRSNQVRIDKLSDELDHELRKLSALEKAIKEAEGQVSSPLIAELENAIAKLEQNR